MTDIALVVFDIAGTTVNDDDSVNRCLRGSLWRLGSRSRRPRSTPSWDFQKPRRLQS